MNTFESGVKRRDRKFPLPVLPPPRFRAEGRSLQVSAKRCTEKLRPPDPGTAGPEGGLIRLPDQAAPSRPNKPHPNRRVSPCLCSQPFQQPALLRPPQKGTRQIDRTASPLSPILQQMRNGRRSHPPRPRADRSQARQCTDPPPSCAPRPKKWRNSRNPSASSQTRHLLTILRPAQIYEPLLAYMNKQALAHEFSYANLYSQNIRRFARKTSMHEVKRLLAFNARPRRSNRCRS